MTDEICKAKGTKHFAIAELLAAISSLEYTSCYVHMGVNIHKGNYYLFISTENRPLKTAFDSVIRPFLKAYNSGEFDSDEELQMEYEDDLKGFKKAGTPITEYRLI